METIGLRVDSETIDEIDEIVEQSHGMTRSTVARRALQRGLERENLIVDIYEDLEHITPEVADQIDVAGRSLAERQRLAESINDVIDYLRGLDEPVKKSDITAGTRVTDDQWVSSVGAVFRALADMDDTPVDRDGRKYLANS